MLPENKACKNCVVKDSLPYCDCEKEINRLAEEKGKPVEFNYCVFNRVAKKLKLSILREILENDK